MTTETTLECFDAGRKGSGPENLKRWLKDPASWAAEAMNLELWSRQKEVLRSVFSNRRTAVPAGHGVGKTFVSAAASLAFLYLRQPSKVITTAPTWTQVRQLLWSEINALYKDRLAPADYPGSASQTRLQIQDDWFALGISPADRVRFQGFHQKHVLVIIDEAPGVRREVYQGADSLMSAGDAHMLMIGNPTERQGHFYDACRSDAWNVLRMGCLDSPNFTGEAVSEELKSRLVAPVWVEEKAREWGEDSPEYMSKVMGYFPQISSDQLISLEWVERAVERYEAGAAEAEGALRMGVDVARYGSDATVYTLASENRVERIEEERGRSAMEIAGRAARLKSDLGVQRIAVDDIGVGGGVVDRLRELGVPVSAVNAGSSALDKSRFLNKRAEMWWTMREWIRNGGAVPRHGRLMEDLTAARYAYSSKGQIKLESKDEMRKRLGRSPDCGDSLALALSVGLSPSGLARFVSGGGGGRLLPV